MQLEIPRSVTLPDRTTAEVKGVSARIVDGNVTEVVYTVEMQSGAWAEVAAVDVAAAVAGVVTPERPE
jgi:hypothetical protein